MSIDWREHSAGIAKGEKCPDTLETLQAAWARDQELILDQKAEISQLKATVNQLRQKRTTTPRRDKPVAIAVCKEVHGHTCQFLNRTQHGMDTLRNGDKLYLESSGVPRAQLETWANDLALHGVGDIETAVEIDALLRGSV